MMDDDEVGVQVEGALGLRSFDDREGGRDRGKGSGTWHTEAGTYIRAEARFEVE
jgi:hypothetical protein